jgi:hypothetical protein
MFPGFAVHGHAARLEAGEDLRDFRLIEGLDFFESSLVVADALTQGSTGNFRSGSGGQVVDYIPKGQFVGIVKIVAFKAIELVRAASACRLSSI